MGRLSNRVFLELAVPPPYDKQEEKPPQKSCLKRIIDWLNRDFFSEEMWESFCGEFPGKLNYWISP